MKRERKVINYQFGDFTSPKGVNVPKANASRVVGKDEQLAHTRALDHQVKSYGNIY